MRSPFLFKFASVAATVAVATTASAVMTPEAQALTITRTVNGVDYYVTTVEGTFNDLESSLRSQPWWGQQPGAEPGFIDPESMELASQFAVAVGDVFGFPNASNILGPFFAYSGSSGGYGGYALDGRDQVVRQFQVGELGVDQTATFATARVVPTPALLPGLLGLGVSVWRKRKANLADAADV